MNFDGAAGANKGPWIDFIRGKSNRIGAEKVNSSFWSSAAEDLWADFGGTRDDSATFERIFPPPLYCSGGLKNQKLCHNQILHESIEMLEKFAHLLFEHRNQTGQNDFWRPGPCATATGATCGRNKIPPAINGSNGGPLHHAEHPLCLWGQTRCR